MEDNGRQRQTKTDQQMQTTTDKDGQRQTTNDKHRQPASEQYANKTWQASFKRASRAKLKQYAIEAHAIEVAKRKLRRHIECQSP